MMNPITYNFQKCINHLKETGSFNSFRQIAAELDMHPQCLSDILKAKREVTLRILNDFVTKFNCNPNFLHTGEGSMFINSDETTASSLDHYNDITYISEAAKAGYIDQIFDPVYLDDLPTFKLPDKQLTNGILRCFDVEGDSMEPTLYNGDKIICRVVENDLWLNNIRPGYVYVFVTNDGIVVKRVESKDKEAGTLMLKSDNNFFEPFEVRFDEIREISILISRITHFRPAQFQQHVQSDSDMEDMRNKVREQSEIINNLSTNIEKLLETASSN